MALQHLRSSTANKRPLPAGMSDGQLAINTNLNSPGVFFKDSNGDLVKVGPVHVGTTAPNSSPAAGGQTGNTKGELWLDTSLTPNELKTWDGSAWVSATGQEIPVSKLIDGSARQLLQTDAAGTGVEWTSNVDVPGTLDVTSTATFDSIASHPLGSAGAPTITFTGDTNTGIYSPGADQVAISTNGTGRLFVNSSGNVGAGTASPNHKLTLEQAGATTFDAYNIRNGATSSTGYAVGLSGTGDVFHWNSTNAAMYFATNNTERLRITSDGKLGFGTSSPGMLIHGANTGAAGLKLQNTTNSITGFLEAGTSNVDIGTETNHNLDFYTNGSFRARLDTSGRLGVGTTSAVTQLDVVGGAISVSGGLPADLTNRLALENSSNISSLSSYGATAGTGQIRFNTGGGGNSGGGEAVRIDSSGRLLVGTSSAPTISGTGAPKLVAIKDTYFISGDASIASPFTQSIQIDIVWNAWGSNNVAALVDLMVTLREYANTGGVAFGKVFATNTSSAATFSTFNTADVTASQCTVTATSGGNYTLRITINPTNNTDYFGYCLTIPRGPTVLSSVTVSLV